MTGPTFIICGAPKSGTSALFGYLAEHPQVCVSRIKEPHFLTNEVGQRHHGLGQGILRGGTWTRGWDWYSGLFDPGPRTRAIGESSTHYISTLDTPHLIKEHLPEARLIFMLRAPVPRLYSHYWEEVRTGLKLPSFAGLVAENHPRFQHLCNVSQYATNLRRFEDLFPRTQMHIIVLEQFRAAPLEHFREVCRFIGVDDDFVPSSLGAVYNSQRMPRIPSIERWMNLLTHPVISDPIPNRLRMVLSGIKKRISRLNSVEYAYPPLDPILASTLAPRFDDDVRYVETLTGMPLPHWRPGHSRDEDV